MAEEHDPEDDAAESDEPAPSDRPNVSPLRAATCSHCHDPTAARTKREADEMGRQFREMRRRR